MRGMTRYADPERCPDCQAAMAYGSRACPQCGLALDGPLAARLFTLLTEADEVLGLLRGRPVAGLSPSPGPEPGDLVPGFATVAAPRRRGLSAASVPQILLGLGAVCLLVAAVVFLAVAWSRLGVAGRTGVLVALTATAGVVTGWLARQGLRAATESLAVVALGLITLDLLGADDAGWLGDLGDAALMVVVGLTLGVASVGSALAVTLTPARALRSGEVLATLGLATAMGGLVLTGWFADSASFTVITVLAGVVTAAARLLRLPVLTTGAGVLAGLAWLVLAQTAWARALDHPSFVRLWVEGEVWPLLAAGVLLGAAAAVPLLTDGLRRVALAAAELVGAAALVAPATDEPFRVGVLALLVVVVVSSVAAWLAPDHAVLALLATPVVAGSGALLVSLRLGALAVERLEDTGTPVWAGAAGDLVPAATGDARDAWLLPLTVAAVALVVLLLVRRVGRVRTGARWLVERLPARSRREALPALVSAVGVLSGLGALTATPLPAWVLVAVPLGAAAAITVVEVLRPDPLEGEDGPLVGRPAWLAAALVLALPALVVGLRSQGLTLVVLLAIVTGTAAVLVRRPLAREAVLAGGLLMPAVAGVVWTLGGLAEAPFRWTALAGLLAVGVVALVPLPTRAASDVAALSGLATAFGLSLAGLDAADRALALGTTTTGVATWAAGYLTVVGGFVVAAALLDPSRSRAGWLGGGLLAAASWLRLADLGVQTPEAYTVPSALALVGVGLLHLHRHPQAGTTSAMSAGLGLGLVPSLLWVIDDPLGPRAVVLGVTCLALVVLGARLRWSAPLLFGAVIGLLVVLRQVAPMVDAVPRWALIGSAGTVLVVLGVTWERRLQEARSVAGYVRALR